MEGLRDVGDPKLFANRYYKQGINELIIVDCSASWFGQEAMFEIIKNINKKIFIPTIIGGGIKNLNDCEKFFYSGADKLIINTGAINKPDIIDQIAKKYGSQSLAVSIHYKYQNNNFELFKCFGREKVKIKIEDWINEILSRGAGEIIFCSIDKDGTGQGFDENILKLIEKMRIKVPVIISGGFGKVEHLNVFKNYKKYVQGVSISKSFHYKEVPILQVKNILNKYEFNE
tara:strand:+ start:146 stop:835 length:690 start_codon:yes stop_codon:yes gene_type:complete